MALDDIRRHCAMQGIEWSVIPGRSVMKLLEISGDSDTFPLSDSVPDVWNKLAL